MHLRLNLAATLAAALLTGCAAGAPTGPSQAYLEGYAAGEEIVRTQGVIGKPAARMCDWGINVQITMPGGGYATEREHLDAIKGCYEAVDSDYVAPTPSPVADLTGASTEQPSPTPTATPTPTRKPKPKPRPSSVTIDTEDATGHVERDALTLDRIRVTDDGATVRVTNNTNREITAALYVAFYGASRDDLLLELGDQYTCWTFKPHEVDTPDLTVSAYDDATRWRAVKFEDLGTCT